MRVVSYARVSTLRQETKGQSLPNQERAFARWVEAGGHDRIASYADAASGWTIEARAEFRRMIDDLPRTKPQAIIVDTLDRFTRNLRDGLNLLEELRGHGVGLLPLDWRRANPVDLDSDDDWREIVDEFTDAEKERRRIRRRVLRSREGRRERGATNTYNPALGIRKNGDRLEPDPETAWIGVEIGTRFVAGEPMRAIARWSAQVHERGWTVAAGVKRALANHSYVTAGVRTPELQRAIDVALAAIEGRYGQTRKHGPTEFAGIFFCGKCWDAGIRHRMSGFHYREGGSPRSGLICDVQHVSAHPDRSVSVAQHLVADQWRALVDGLLAGGAIERWASAGEEAGAERRLMLERRLAQLDQQAAATKERRNRAFDLLADRQPAVTKQAKKMLVEVEADEAAIAAARQSVLGELVATPTRERDPALLRAALAAYSEVYEAEDAAGRNRLNRALVAVVGSGPRLYRDGPGGKGSRWHSPPVLRWPEVEELRPPPPLRRPLAAHPPKR